MLKKNYYKRITESIVNAYHDHNLDTAMEDDGSENMGKKIVAIITADPDEELDWESEYEPFGATELTADDEAECCEHDGIEHDTCPSCGTDVDGHIVSDDEDEDDENDDMEDIMIGGGFESEDEVDEYEDMDVKDILVDILQELKGEDSDSEEEGAFETSDENPMFGNSEESDDEEDDYEDDEDDADSMLEAQDDWSSEESDDDDSDTDTEEEYDEEEDFEGVADEYGVEQEDVDGMLTSPEQEEVEIFDCLDNA